MKLSFFGIKLLGISFVTIIYFLLGFFSAKTLDFIFRSENKDDENKKPVWQVCAEILLRLSIFGILIYISRNIVERIPFPLDGVAGFHYLQLKELRSEIIFTIPLLVFHNKFNTKLETLYNRLEK